MPQAIQGLRLSRQPRMAKIAGGGGGESAVWGYKSDTEQIPVLEWCGHSQSRSSSPLRVAFC
jgi:hypothetical protein